jgi:energy-coupling factor transport system permease protein
MLFSGSSQLVIGQYVPTGSVIHRLNPVLKLILVFVMMVALFIFNNGIDYLIVACFWLLAFLLSGISITFLLRGLKPVFFLVVITFILHLLVTSGEPQISLYFFSISKPGLINASFFAGRLLLLVGFTSLLTLSTSAIELTFALERCSKPLVPLGFPAEEFAMMLTISLRFIPVLFGEMEKIMKAQICRGANFSRGGIITRIKNYLSLLVPLFANAFQRAYELALAMEVRCYQAGGTRTAWRSYPLHSRDVIALILTASLIGALVYRNIYL